MKILIFVYNIFLVTKLILVLLLYNVFSVANLNEKCVCVFFFFHFLGKQTEWDLRLIVISLIIVLLLLFYQLIVVSSINSVCSAANFQA